MTLRTLFNIILKVLGIFFIKDFLAMASELVSSVIYLMHSGTTTETIWTFVTVILILIMYGLVIWCLIFKTNLIINKLKLDKGFAEDTISLNTHRSTILSISVIVIGGLLVVDEIPNLCQQLHAYYQQRRINHGAPNPSISYSVVSGVKIIIGLFLMAGQRQIVSLIELQRKK